MTGLDNLKGPDGNQFYNTQAGKLIASSAETPTLVFSFKLQLDQKTAYNIFNSFSSSYDFDYFLQNTQNGREIHFVGYKPTELYKGYEADRKEAGKNYYCNKDGFVWALKAPVEMGWAIEKDQLLKVYPLFKNWLESGGYELENSTQELQWYNHPDMRIPYIDPREH